MNGRKGEVASLWGNDATSRMNSSHLGWEGVRSFYKVGDEAFNFPYGKVNILNLHPSSLAMSLLLIYRKVGTLSVSVQDLFDSPSSEPSCSIIHYRWQTLKVSFVREKDDNTKEYSFYYV